MSLTRERIVDAGLAMLETSGYDHLSMRGVADLLGVQAGSLYYHVASKRELLRLMADRVAQQAYEAASAALDRLSSPSWQESVLTQLRTLRQTVLAQPGGVVLLVESPKVLSTGVLSLMERMMQTLVDAGVPVPAAGAAADVLFSYVAGFALQEEGDDTFAELSEALSSTLQTRFPLTARASAASAGTDLFEAGIEVICAGVARRWDPDAMPPAPPAGEP